MDRLRFSIAVLAIGVATVFATVVVTSGGSAHTVRPSEPSSSAISLRQRMRQMRVSV
jgi:hypothetical protein